MTSPALQEVFAQAVAIYERDHGPVGDWRIVLCTAVEQLLRSPRTPEDDAALLGGIAEHRALHIQATDAGVESPFQSAMFHCIDAARTAVRNVTRDAN